MGELTPDDNEIASLKEGTQEEKEREDREKIISKTKETNLCVNCWLSGDCEREKKAKRSREIITDCRGYIPENK